jgi:hypothetical protein
VYEPKLEVDETGAQLPSPSLPNITARRLYEQWLKRARALNPGLAPAQVDTAASTLVQWSELVPDSASDAYHWEVEKAVDKRVIRHDVLASEERAAQVLETPAPAVAYMPAAPRYKLFSGGAQHGPYSLDDIALRIARGEVTADTRVWNMGWNPKADKWQSAGQMAELAELFGDTIPDPDDGIPDPQ